jgi:uridylate kinase
LRSLLDTFNPGDVMLADALYCNYFLIEALMAKGVDGVYDSDPRTNPDAVRFEHLTPAEVLARNLKVADATAISMCQDNDLPIVVFNLLVEGNIARAVRGEQIGTLVSSD